jgi:heat-inducible transcriptional repressor
MIPERSLEVLRAIVQDYIALREPVGSKALVERHAFGVSAATIRNDMALLEDEELIHAPHTSAGRVPTDKGYRLFVDRLSEVKPLSAAERQAIESFMLGSVDLDELLHKTVRLLSSLTNQVAVVQYPTLGKASVKHIELVSVSECRVLVILITNSGRIQQHVVELAGEISAATLAAVQNRLNSDLVGKPLSAVAGLIKTVEATLEPELSSQLMPLFQTLNSQIDANSQEKLLLAGTSNLVRSGQDFDGGITGVLDAIEEQVVLLKLISEMSTETDGVSLRIGKETGLDSFSSASAVFSGYENQGAEIAKIGVIGPTRMDYAQNIAAVTAIARYLTRALGS